MALPELTARPALALTGVSKSFAGAQALRDVSLTMNRGEVHGLLGENGSGKSTLVKILAGYHVPDGGELEVHGVAVRLPLPPGKSRSMGLEFVHQDLGLIPSLTVLENLRIEGMAQPKNRWLVSWRQERRRARALFADYGLDIDPSAKVSMLQPVERAFVAIVRALEGLREVGETEGSGRAILVLDEPTVFLSNPDRERLFAFVRQIASAGGAIILVSHDLDDVRAHTDRITVLRDGRAVGTVETRDTPEAELISMIIGRSFEKVVATRREQRRVPEASAHAARVDSLRGGRVSAATFDIAPGEVLGVTGQIGAGFEDVPYLIFGAVESEEGTVSIGPNRHDLTAMTPAGAIQLGIALLPADRQSSGSIPSLPAVENLMLQVLNRYFTHAVLNRKRMLVDAQELFDKFDVRPSDPKLTYSSFSGGNQQKALMAKWLQTDPSLLLLHEPTIGVDIGARQTIFGLIRDAAASGTSVLCASVDHEQLADVCDRVLIFSRGRIIHELSGEHLTKENVTQRCYDVAVTATSDDASAMQLEGGIGARSS